MTIYKPIITSLFIASASLASAQTTILEISEATRNGGQSVPESFETDTHKMLENWYLQNYAVLDKDADERSSVRATDEEIIERLGALPTTIEMPYNSIVRNFIDMYTDRRKQLVENMLGMSLYYMPIFEAALDRHGLPMELKYLPVIESALNPVAVSRAGATGLWQFMLPTAKGLGLEVNSLVDQRRDPYASSEAAALYLKQLYEIFGDWSLAIASYNCGPGNVNKALQRAGGGKKDFWDIYPFLPAETRGYVPAFIAANYVMNNYNKHNISPALARKPLLTDTIHVNKRVDIHQISDVLAIPVDEIRALNPQYKTDVIPGNIKPYSLVLPSLQVYAYIANEDSIVNHDASKYSRRDIVEPSDGSITGSDARGEYVEQLTVKYHTVRKGETLNSIAKKYGVSASSIRKSNKIGKSVRKGQKLKINTYTRIYKEPEPIEPISNDSISLPSDSIYMATPEIADSLSADTIAAEPPAVVQPVVTNQEPKVQTPAKPKTHKVVKGETLSKISRKYGVTIDDIKKANDMKDTNIRIGQRLKIPQK